MDRERFIWDLMANDPMLRQAVNDIEAITETDQMVEELIALFRGVDEVLVELQECVFASVTSQVIW